MSDIKSTPSELVMTLEITRAATGLKETVQVVCTPIKADEQSVQHEGETQCP